MPLSPAQATVGSSLNRYLASWRAIETLVHRGQSWSGHERNCAFLNTRAQRFANVSAATGLDFDDDARALATVDWDHDGDLDLWIANRTGPRLRLLRNESNPARTGHHFVALRLEGTTSPRDGVGARVEVVLDQQPKLAQTLHAGDAFLSQSGSWLHFGLGREPAIRRVIVRWPRGQEETFTGVTADGRFVLREGAGVARPGPVPNRSLQLMPGTPGAVKPTDGGRVLFSTPIPLPVLFHTNFTTGLGVAGWPTTNALLINLWASWCAPCLAELKTLAGRETDWREAGLELLALSVDGLDRPGGVTAAKRSLTQAGWPFLAGGASAEWLEKLEIVLDRLFDRHVPLAVPTSLLVDPRGNLSVLYRGPVDPGTLENDLALIEAPPLERRDHAVPFPGRWYGRPGQVVLEQLAGDFRERFPDEAMRYRRLAGETNAGAGQLDVALGWLRQGRIPEAATQLRELLRAEPENTEAMAFGAELLRLTGQPRQAVQVYQQALRLRPDFHDAAHRLARLLATHADPEVRDGAIAVRLARRAAEAMPERAAEFLDTLAAAYAEAGRFAEATATAQRALDAARLGGQAALTPEIEAHLRLFQQRRPLRLGQ